jgi:hypothetical protein
MFPPCLPQGIGSVPGGRTIFLQKMRRSQPVWVGLSLERGSVLKSCFLCFCAFSMWFLRSSMANVVFLRISGKQSRRHCGSVCKVFWCLLGPGASSTPHAATAATAAQAIVIFATMGHVSRNFMARRLPEVPALVFVALVMVPVALVLRRQYRGVGRFTSGDR